jgi:hypothetical protein
MLHEWGHLIGMKHGSFGQYALTTSQDTRDTTIMSHVEKPNGTFQSGYTSLDIRALQYIYGTADARDAGGVLQRQLGNNGMLSQADDEGRTMVGLISATDVMVGGAADDRIYGLDGDDVLIGGGGSNLLSGGRGNDLSVWQDINFSEIASGRNKLFIWMQHYDSKSWSGVLIKEDGKIDYFADIEKFQFSDQVISLSKNIAVSYEIGLERLFMIAFQQNKNGSSFQGHLSKLYAGTQNLEDMVKSFIESKWFSKPLGWDDMNVVAKVQALWNRTYPGTELPENFKNWVNATGDFYAAMTAIIIDPSSNLKPTLDQFSILNNNKTISSDIFEINDVIFSVSEKIQAIYQFLFDRDPTPTELASASLRHEWYGISLHTQALELIESTEFRDLILNDSHQLFHVANLAYVNTSSYKTQIIEYIDNIISHDTVITDSFNLISRNGSYGLTMGTGVNLNDTVVSYSYMRDISSINVKNNAISFNTQMGQEISAPVSVHMVKFFDGMIYIGEVTSADFGYAIADSFFAGMPGDIAANIFANFAYQSASRKEVVEFLFSNYIFVANFNAKFAEISPTESVQSIYRFLLGREPTYSENFYYAMKVAAGSPLIDIAHAISLTDEMNARYTSTNGILRIEDNYSAGAIKLYEALLTRIDNWAVDKIKLGYEFSDIINGILTSTEYNTVRLRADLSSGDFVTLLYKGFFDQNPNDDTLSVWVTALDSGYARSSLVSDLLSYYLNVFSKQNFPEIHVSAEQTFQWNMDDALKSLSAPSSYLPATESSIYSIAALSADKFEPEKGIVSFTFSISRTGDISQAASLKWELSGFGTNPVTADDFLGNAWLGGKISFAPNQDVLTLAIDVVGDAFREDDEGFLVKISENSTESNIPISIASGIIRNNDILNLQSDETLEHHGKTYLIETGDRYFMVDSIGGSGPAIRFNAAELAPRQLGAWAPIAAEASSSGYQVVWKLAGADQFIVWNTDANGNYSSDASSVMAAGRLPLQLLEQQFQQDLNSDGHLGPITAALETYGQTYLTKAADGYALFGSSTGTGPSLKFGAADIADSQFGAWTPIAAEASSSGYQVVWKLAGADQFIVWNTDANGNYSSDASSVMAAGRLDLQLIEPKFQQDLNNDGHIGSWFI